MPSLPLGSVDVGVLRGRASHATLARRSNDATPRHSSLRFHSARTDCCVAVTMKPELQPCPKALHGVRPKRTPEARCGSRQGCIRQSAVIPAPTAEPAHRTIAELRQDRIARLQRRGWTVSGAACPWRRAKTRLSDVDSLRLNAAAFAISLQVWSSRDNALGIPPAARRQIADLDLDLRLGQDRHDIVAQAFRQCWRSRAPEQRTRPTDRRPARRSRPWSG